MNAQEPNIRNQQEPNIRNAQEPNIRNNQTPFTYQHRSPVIYTVPVNAQQPYIANAQTNQPYNLRVPVPYNHRSPFIYQHTYSNRRPIGPVAKVKGVFLKEAQGVSKVDKVFVKTNYQASGKGFQDYIRPFLFFPHGLGKPRRGWYIIVTKEQWNNRVER